MPGGCKTLQRGVWENRSSYLGLWPARPGHVVTIWQTTLSDELPGGIEKCAKPPMLLEIGVHPFYIFTALFNVPVYSTPRRGVHLGFTTASDSMESLQVG